MDNETLIAEFVAYQRGKGLADRTIDNRLSIITRLARTSTLRETTVFELRRILGMPGIKASSRRTYRGALIAFFSFLHEDGIRDDDPSAKLPRIKVPKGEPRPLSPDQVDRMLASGAYKRTRAMILLGYYQGFRAAMIARVDGDDVTLPLDERGEVARDEDGQILGGTIRTIGKGSKERVLPLHPMIAELALSMPRHGLWFAARDGSARPIRSQSVSALITKAMRRAGIADPTLSPHSLRHGFGTDLVEAGVDIRVVQELMMHDSLATTQIYTRVSEQRKRAAIVALPSRAVPGRSGRGPTGFGRKKIAA